MCGADTMVSDLKERGVSSSSPSISRKSDRDNIVKPRAVLNTEVCFGYFYNLLVKTGNLIRNCSNIKGERMFYCTTGDLVYISILIHAFVYIILNKNDAKLFKTLSRISS